MRFVVVLLLMWTAMACSVDPMVVGGECTADSACEDRCLTGEKFPGGMCAVTCRTDADCPAATLCIKHAGQAFCLPECSDASSCRDGYRCTEQDRSGFPSPLPVCIND